MTVKFRVWMILDVPGEPIYIPVTTLKDACLVLDTMVAIRRNLEERELPVWTDDVSGVEFSIDGDDWEDFYDTDGDDFEKYYDTWTESDFDNDDAQLFNQNLIDLVPVGGAIER